MSALLDQLCETIEKEVKKIEDKIAEKRKDIDRLSEMENRAKEYRWINNNELHKRFKYI